MFPYWLLFTLCAAGAVQNRAELRLPGRTGPVLPLLGLVILLMIGLRYEVGGDWENYVSIFNGFRHTDAAEAMARGDPGYSLLNWISLEIGGDIWFVNLVCALFFTWGLVRFTTQQPNPWLVLVVAVPYLIIVVGMGYTRQAVAIGFILAGLSDLRRHPSMVRFAFYIIAAALFHRTAIIVLPLVAMAGTRNRWVMAGLGAALAAILFYLLLNAEVDRLMENYVQAQYDAQGALIRVVMNVVPALIFLTFQHRFALHEADRRLWRNFSLAALAALVMLAVLPSSVVVDRLALYLIPLQLIVFSRLPFAFPKDGRPNGLMTLAVIAYSAAVQFVWLTLADHAHFWVPYKFYIG